MKVKRAIARGSAALVGVALTFASPIAFACSVCLGDPDSPLVHGAKAGVILLGGVVYGVIMLMGVFVAHCIMRARRLERSGADDSSRSPLP